MIFSIGATSQSIDVQIVGDDGLPVTGLVAATFPAVVWSLAGANADVSLSLSDLAAITTAWASGGVFERGGGVYRMDCDNAMFTAAGEVKVRGEATGKHLLAPWIEVGVSAGVTLADGVAHGGTPGSSTATFALEQLNIQHPYSHAVICIGGGAAGRGMYLAGSGTGPGLLATGGPSGDGVYISGGGVSGHGVNLIASGADSHGLLSTGGGSGVCDGIKGVAGTGGVDLRGSPLQQLEGTFTTTSSSVFTSAALTNAPTGGSAPTVEEIDTQLSGTHGAGSWATATGFATPGAQMALVDGAVTDAKFTVPALSAPATGPVGYLYQLWRRYFKQSDYDGATGLLKTFADNNVTVITTQTVSTVGTTQIVGPAT